MRTVNVKFVTVKDVQTFVELVRQFDGDIDLSSGRYVIDAKSIMGIFSLDLSKPITLTAKSTNEANCDKLIADLKNYIVD